jgi:hypothetical protein
MKFKVINERTKEVVGSGLAICAAREVAKKYNNIEKVDYFCIKEQKPHKNGEEISEVIKREIKELLTNMINQYPNDASLGAEIRKQYKR